MIDDAEAVRHDTDNRARLGIDHDGAADDGTVATEATLPVSIANHDVLCAVRRLIRRRQLPASQRGNTECFENPVGDKDDIDLLRLSALNRNYGDVLIRQQQRSLRVAALRAERRDHCA